jgi:hypothetical protein
VPQLRSLGICYGNMGDERGQALADELHQVSYLQYVNLCNSHIGLDLQAAVTEACPSECELVV